MPLTGRFEFRRTLTGKVVLRVEEERERRWTLGSRARTYRRWRHATMTDLMQRELGDLLDLKNGAPARAASPSSAESRGRASPAGDHVGRKRRLPRADSFDLESRDAAE